MHLIDQAFKDIYVSKDFNLK